MGIKLNDGYCNACDDGVLRPVIGKRDKALCVNHYNNNWRANSKPLEQKSETKEKEDKIYLQIRKVFLHDNRYCVAHWNQCKRGATEVHHTKGHGDYYLDVETWLPLCGNCHYQVGILHEKALRECLSQERLTKTKIVLPFKLNLENSILKSRELIT